MAKLSLNVWIFTRLPFLLMFHDVNGRYAALLFSTVFGSQLCFFFYSRPLWISAISLCGVDEN